MRSSTFAVALVGSLALASSIVAGPARAQESQLDSLRAAANSSSGGAAAALAYGRALRRAGRSGAALSELRRAKVIARSAPAQAEALAAIDWELARTYME
ncbi:MAG: hypothetical protein WBY94_21260, partial [Polyangiaceae bacterium]